MAMNPMQKKARTSFLLGMLLTLVITGIIIGLLIAQLAKIKKEEEAIVYKTVYVLSDDVTSGELIDGRGTLMAVRAEGVPNNAITSPSQLTEMSTARIDLKQGTVLTIDMVSEDGKELTKDMRLQEYNMVNLPTQLEEGETVDIRFRLPNGADYIVLSNKHVEQTDSSSIWLEVSEGEILTMSSAIIESYIMEGSYLYATTYVDAGMQDSSSPTYVANSDVIQLMNMDKDYNITAEEWARIQELYQDKNLAQRNNVINPEVEGYSENALSNIEAAVSEERERMRSARQEYVDGLN